MVVDDGDDDDEVDDDDAGLDDDDDDDDVTALWLGLLWLWLWGSLDDPWSLPWLSLSVTDSHHPTATMVPVM